MKLIQESYLCCSFTIAKIRFMILIADSGSTKTQWVLLDGKKVVFDITTKGFNPYYYRKKDLEDDLENELFQFIEGHRVEKVYFFGAGCSTDNNCALVKNALLSLIPDAEIHVGHDLDGAALALLQDKEGIACILGTGSNSCMWDGRKVTGHVPSLGYLLGDEGSGTYIGKLMLQKILYGEAGQSLSDLFYREYDLDFERTLNEIYGKPNPNKFISSVSKFVGENIDDPVCEKVVRQAFEDFFDKQLSKYPGYQEKTVSFTGSVAYFYQPILRKVCEEKGITIGLIMKNPMVGLIDYYTRDH